LELLGSAVNKGKVKKLMPHSSNDGKAMAPPLIRTLLRGLIAAGIFGTCALGILSLQQGRLRQIQTRAQSPALAQAQQALSLNALNRLPKGGLGFNNLIADWTFLRFLDYYGDEEARDQTGFGTSPIFFDVITSRDPRFVDTYLFLSGTLSYQLGQPELAMKYMQRGLDALSPQIHARAYQVPSFMGMDQLLLLGDTAGASQSYAKATEWAKASIDPQERKVAQVFNRVSTYLQRDPDSSSVRFWAWNLIFAQSGTIGDRKTQDRARAELLTLGAQEAQDPKTGQITFTPPIPKPRPTPTATPTPTPTPTPSLNGQ
jgi:tetratricopeptide (TPR) repeat protein